VRTVGDPVDVDAARARANAATPGPWVLSEPQGNWIWPHICNTYASKRADAVFIAAARSDVPALADEVERLRAEVARVSIERDLAVAHDRQPYPTAWAYERVCELMHERTAERDAALAEVTRLNKRLRKLCEDAEHESRRQLPGTPYKAPSVSTATLRYWFPAALGGGSDD
jgi:hypothetical protein